MNRSLTLALAPLWLAATAHAQSPPGIVISQYYEGTSNNRYLELSNPTASPIPLAGKRVTLWSNAARETWKTGGAPSASFDLGSISPGISLQPGGFLLLANPSVALPAYAVAKVDAKPSASGQQVLNFNGDDSVVLYSSDSYLPENILDAVSFTGNNGQDKTFYRLNTNRGWASDIGSQITDFPSVWAADKTLADVATAQPSDHWYLSASTDQPVVSTPPAQSPNTAPTVVIKAATMRGATGLMDVVFRVNDPDDTTVKTRALAFIDGQRSFAKLIKPSTFAEGTASKIGGAIATNTDHTLTWNVAADWNIDLGQIKFEILAMDNRGLLPLDWVTIPAANGQPELTISKNAPTDQEVLDALFWQYASGDPGLTLENGELRGTASSGLLVDVALVTATSVHSYGPVYALKAMNLAPAGRSAVSRIVALRANLTDRERWHALNRPYALSEILLAGNGNGTIEHSSFPDGLDEVIGLHSGANSHLALIGDGTVVAWGNNDYGQTSIPNNLSGVTAIGGGGYHSLALKSDGSVVAWGNNWDGQTNVPAGLTGVTAIAAGGVHNLALKSDGSVVAWGGNQSGQTNVPAGLAGVTAIAAGWVHNLALKGDGSVVAWGYNGQGQTNVPVGLTGVTAIAAGGYHNLAFKNDGSVVAWGYNGQGQTNVPVGLTGITAIVAGFYHSLAIKSNGSVVAWGSYYNDRSGAYPNFIVPIGLSGVTAITSGFSVTGLPEYLALKKAP